MNHWDHIEKTSITKEKLVPNINLKREQVAYTGQIPPNVEYSKVPFDSINYELRKQTVPYPTQLSIL